jgi:hypothetical protein
MTALSRPSACAARGFVLLIAGALVVWYRPAGQPRGGEPGADPWCRSEADDGPDRERRRAEALEAESALVRRLLDAKARTIADLLARRLTFPEAVARFRELDTGVREDWKAHERDAEYGGCTEDERVRRSVIAWARAALREQPEGAKVLAGLEAEAREQLRCPAARRLQCSGQLRRPPL